VSIKRDKAMQAVVYHGPNDIRVEERPIPEIGPDEALLKISAASICGTDLRIWHGGHRKFTSGEKRILGHEVVGRIDELGEKVKGVELGQRVFVAPNMGCGLCRQCVTGNTNLCANYSAFGVTIDGAFAEYMLLPSAAIHQGNLIPIGEDMDGAVAALIEPFACVLRGQDALYIQPGEVVLIVGAGPIGVMHMMLAHLRGVRSAIVSEVIPERVAQARSLGAIHVVNPEQENLKSIVLEHSEGMGADAIVIAAPAHQAQEEALELAAVGGRINYFGGLPKDCPTITFNSNLVHYKELVVTGTTGSNTEDCRRAAALISSGQIDLSGIVSARYPLGDAQEAFAFADERQALKVVLEPGSE
jgi:L-iditol 2-dehydrogenase